MIVTITGLGARGDGLAEVAGEQIFVPFALPGERAEIERDGNRGTLVSILDESPDRVDPPCRLFGACGGCGLQHMASDPYAGFKRDLVVSTLARTGIGAPVAPLVDGRGAGRRRVTLHADGKHAGYMRARSHDLLDVATCPILVPALREAAPALTRAVGRGLGPCDVQVTATETGLDVAVRAKRRASTEALALLAAEFDVARIALHGEALVVTRPPVVRMGRATVAPPIGGFLQATAAGEAALAQLVLAGVGDAKAVADLFCGVGPFALRLAERVKVTAWDSHRGALDALDDAARHTPGLRPVATGRRDLFRDPLAPAELDGFDAVVFDPPRAGAAAQARELARGQVPTVVAVSCEPRSFARDAAILVAGGYRLVEVTPVDQFAYSAHIELVGVFRR